MGVPLVELSEVWKSFNGVTAVAGLSFSLAPGRILGLLGPNGAGKTTTLRMILDILRPDRGRVVVLGSRVDSHTRDRVGYMPEERGLYKKMKVEELLHFFGAINGLSRSTARREAEFWLRRFDLWDRRKSNVEDFSKGMQQKVQFIATILHRPPLLILDEPFSGLDPVNTHLFEALLTEMRGTGTGIIYSTHILEQAERLLDDVILLKKGSAVVQGELAEVKHRFGAGWIEIRCSASREILEQLPGVMDIRLHGDKMRLRVTKEASPPALLERLVRAGVEVHHFVPLEASLNDIFLTQVGGLELETVAAAPAAAGGAS